MAARRVGVVMAGLGGVGRAFVRVLRERFSDADLEIRIVAIGDSTGYLLKTGTEGFAWDEVESIITHKLRGEKLVTWSGSCTNTADSLIAALEVVKTDELWNDFIVVDCTSSSAITPALIRAKELGYGVAMANKLPVGGPIASYSALVGDHTPRVRYEATVGAGLPVVDVVKRIVASKDVIKLIQGSLSGTMTYILSAMDRGMSFSDGLKGAHREGITEADPREDLSGADVARKMVILARELGMHVETSDVQITPLFPASAFALSVDKFMASVQDFDEDIRHQWRAAREIGNTLAYIGSIVPGGPIEIKLQQVPASSLFASASSTEAVVSISSEWFPEPLWMRGTAAGVESTAAAVAGDVAAIICSR